MLFHSDDLVIFLCNQIECIIYFFEKDFFSSWIEIDSLLRPEMPSPSPAY